MKLRGLSGLLICVSIFCAKSALAGPKWEFGEDSWMQLGLLGQVHYSHQEKAEQENDFYLRRGRIMLSGQVTDGVKVFAQTDNANAGRQGYGSAKTEIQDAFVDVRLGQSSHWLQSGLILLPFSLENNSSATSQLGLDYNSEAIKFVNTFTWRDYGVALRGTLGDRIGYRLGAFDGYDKDDSIKSDDADLRLVGRIDLALLGDDLQNGWFYAQNQLGKKRYLIAGAGYNRQNDATFVNDLVQKEEAWVIDFQSSFPFGEEAALLLNGAYYDWDNALYQGGTAFLESGVLYDVVMGTFKWATQDKDEHSAIHDYTFGLHYFMDRAHNYRVGLEYRFGDSDNWLLGGVQFLL